MSESAVTMKSAGLVVGAGVAGIEAAVKLADQGFIVYLVEKNPSIGGRMAQLSRVFPELDCASNTLTPRMIEAGKHPNVRMLHYSEVKDIRREGDIFKVRILKKPRFVDENRCTGCGVCAQHCPVEIANDFDERIGVRNAIYIPFPNAVPQVYTIDKEHCLRCGLCQNVCMSKAVDFEQRPETIEVEAGAIIIASGFNPFDPRKYEEYSFSRYDNVITGLTLERLLSLSGPTGGHVLRLSDGKIPKKIAFMQCVSPENPKSGKMYCSEVCCMYATKQAELLKELIPGADITIYHAGSLKSDEGLEEYYKKARNEYGIKYSRAKITEVVEKPTHNLLIRASTGESGKLVENEVDMLVLSTGLVPSPNDFVDALRLKLDEGGFFEAVDSDSISVQTSTEGVFVVGAAEGPKDIAKSVKQADAAALKASTYLRKLGEVKTTPTRRS
jgi:heterodisulfide reductase subunit A